MDITYRTEYGFLEVEPTGKLSEKDFQHLAKELEHIRQSGRELKGILFNTQEFPGYKDFADVIAHGKFIKDQHAKVRKVALCTDSTVAPLMQAFGDAFADAEVEKFAYEEKDKAEKWLLN